MSRAAAGLSVALAVLLSSGCVRRFVVDETKFVLASRYVHNRPIEEVWPTVRELLLEEGYSLRESANSYELVTEWRTDSSDSVISGSYSRYLAFAERLEADRCIVRFVRANGVADGVQEHAAMGTKAFTTRAAGGASGLNRVVSLKGAGKGFWTRRDLKMEWRLLARLRPDIAQQTDEEIQRHLPDWMKGDPRELKIGTIARKQSPGAQDPADVAAMTAGESVGDGASSAIGGAPGPQVATAPMGASVVTFGVAARSEAQAPAASAVTAGAAASSEAGSAATTGDLASGGEQAGAVALSPVTGDRSSTTREGGTAPSAPLTCGEALHGEEAITGAPRLVLLGETHGTVEVPRFVGQLACRAARAGRPVAVGLEIPADEQRRIDAYLDSDGSGEAKAALMRGGFWRRAWQDGRSSAAMVALIDQLRQLKQEGRAVNAFAFDVRGMGGNRRQQMMAKQVIAARARHPEALTLVLTGNVQARVVKGTEWDAALHPMGARLLSTEPEMLSLDAHYSGGHAWTCRLASATETVCASGLVPAPQRTRILGRGMGSNKEVDEKHRHLTYVRVNQEEAGGAHHGIFYLGRLSASPPAIPDPKQHTVLR